MKNNTVVSLKQPATNSSDTLTELLRHGAKELIKQAVDAELEELLSDTSVLFFMTYSVGCLSSKITNQQ